MKIVIVMIIALGSIGAFAQTTADDSCKIICDEQLEGKSHDPILPANIYWKKYRRTCSVLSSDGKVVTTNEISGKKVVGNYYQGQCSGDCKDNITKKREKAIERQDLDISKELDICNSKLVGYEYGYDDGFADDGF